jgi:hypothetical protein
LQSIVENEEASVKKLICLDLQQGLKILKLKHNHMRQNMGKADRIIRVLAAAVIAILYINNTITGIFAYVLLAVGAVFLLTSLVGSCPLYSLVGINTCGIKKTE